MAEMVVLGSSSKGNCYLLHCGGETLIIEAGLSLNKIKEGLNYHISNVVGCIVTHAHGDHIQSAEKLAGLGIHIYASQGTLQHKKLSGNYFHPVKELKPFEVSKFKITPFQTQHDCPGNEPFGYVIEHKEIGKLVFATDTYFIKYAIFGVDHFFVECNYQREILEENLKTGVMNDFRARRLLRSHYELKNLCKYLEKCIDFGAKNIVLLHLSGDNSNGKEMKKEVEKYSKNAKVTVAKTGVIIPLEADI